MLRRLYHQQPESFAFTPANAEWAKGQMAKYPEGRQASAVIPILWRAQEQEGWVTRPMIEAIARMLGMAEIRVLEVASFYFMFQMAPVGSVAHVQVCGTTSCMICGAEDLIGVCREKIAPEPHTLSADGRFSWEEVECLGACANAPMAQIGKDYYEDLSAESFTEVLDAFARGEVPVPGSRKGRFSSEPLGGLTTLKGFTGDHDANASVTIANALGDTVKRIDGTGKTAGSQTGAGPITRHAETSEAAAPMPTPVGPASDAVPSAGKAPELLKEARGGKPDDLKRIKGVGPKIEGILHDLGIFHFDQIAAWTGAEIAWVDERLKFKGRIAREGWIEQARALAAGKEG